MTLKEIAGVIGNVTPGYVGQIINGHNNAGELLAEDMAILFKTDALMWRELRFTPERKAAYRRLIEETDNYIANQRARRVERIKQRVKVQRESNTTE